MTTEGRPKASDGQRKPSTPTLVIKPDLVLQLRESLRTLGVDDVTDITAGDPDAGWAHLTFHHKACPDVTLHTFPSIQFAEKVRYIRTEEIAYIIQPTWDFVRNVLGVYLGARTFEQITRIEDAPQILREIMVEHAKERLHPDTPHSTRVMLQHRSVKQIALDTLKLRGAGAGFNMIKR